MQQIKLKLLVSKLGLVSIYMLFLSVQLKLKYTFSESIFSDYPATISGAKTGASLEKSQDSKSAAQKLRLNKRYVHQEIYLVDPFIVRGINKLDIKVDEPFLAVPPISSHSICHALLRGPPASSTLPC